MQRWRDGVRRRVRALLWRLLQAQVVAEIEARTAAGDVQFRIDEGDARVLDSRRIAARALPRPQDGLLTVVEGGAAPGADLPVPPRELWAVHDDYLGFGERHAATLREVCERHGLPLEGRRHVLDFGCGTGRVLRHLVDLTVEGEVWGADIDATRIDWCRANLAPPFRFLTLNTAPHLPFEDNTFDLVFAGSVFTHITDQDDAWLLELRRVTRPAGLLYLSVMDQAMVRRVLEEPSETPYHDWFLNDLETTEDVESAFRSGAARLDEGAGMFALGDPSWIPNVFHDRRYLERHWGSMLEWLEAVESAWFKQTVIVLRKRA